MKKLSKETVKQAKFFISSKGRELEKARFNFLFNNGSSMDVINELKKYQNADGGFGTGLEPDFILPLSSPMATTVAFQIIEEINGENADMLVSSGINYFLKTIIDERKGWFAVPNEVNEYPHAPWWNYDLKEGMTVIDKSWGNPSAEIIGYLLKHKELVDESFLDELVDYSINYLLQKEEFNSEHEIYCFIIFYNTLPLKKRNIIEYKLTNAVKGLVCNNPDDWNKYTPQPVHFVKTEDSSTFGIQQKDIDVNLDYIIESLNEEGGILPNWKWGQYDKSWEKAKDEWAGILTLNALKILYNYGRIDI